MFYCGKFQTYTEVEPYIKNAHVFITNFIKANPLVLPPLLPDYSEANPRDPIISSVNISSLSQRFIVRHSHNINTSLISPNKEIKKNFFLINVTFYII